MPIPTKIHHKKKSNSIVLYWQDGTSSHIEGAKLRQYCPCSSCRARDVVGKQLINDNDKVQYCSLMGTTGIQIVFEDGHDRGVYPWAYLHAIAEGTALDFIYEENIKNKVMTHG